MKIRSLKYHLKEGTKSVTKNGLMSIASIASVAVCSFMLIISLCLAINIDSVLEKLEENIGISIYLGEIVSDEEIRDLFDRFGEIPNVTLVEYMSKQDALDWAKSEWGDDEGILAGLEEDNPFPRSFEISINGAKNQKQVINSINKIQQEFEIELIESKRKEIAELKNILQNPLSEIVEEGIDELSETEIDFEEMSTAEENIVEEVININDKNYNYIGIEKVRHSQNESDMLLALNNLVRFSSIIIIIILAIISIAIIINTIKLTVYVRRTEINIMKYVGATDWFIRWPFIIEGIIIGIIGSVISTVICIFGYSRTVNLITTKISIVTNYIEFKDTLTLFLAIAPATIVLGALLGVIGSVNSIKKYLNV